MHPERRAHSFLPRAPPSPRRRARCAALRCACACVRVRVCACLCARVRVLVLVEGRGEVPRRAAPARRRASREPCFNPFPKKTALPPYGRVSSPSVHSSESSCSLRLFGWSAALPRPRAGRAAPSDWGEEKKKKIFFRPLLARAPPAFSGGARAFAPMAFRAGAKTRGGAFRGRAAPRVGGSARAERLRGAGAVCGRRCRATARARARPAKTPRTPRGSGSRAGGAAAPRARATGGDAMRCDAMRCDAMRGAVCLCAVRSDARTRAPAFRRRRSVGRTRAGGATWIP